MSATYDTWSEVFYNISPYSWAYVGIALSLAASIIGAGWYIINYLGESLLLELVYLEQLLKLLESDQRTLLGTKLI